MAHPDVWLPRLLAWHARHLVRNTLLYLAGVVLVAAAVYALAEGSDIDYADGLWWSVVTLTTVGYGDIAPASVGMRVVAVWVIASGIVSVALLTGWIAAKLAVAAIADADRTPGIDDDFDALSADLADAVARVQHIQEQFRRDERGDDRLAAAAREVVQQLANGSGSVDRAAVGRLRAALAGQEATDA
jgi:hypothetical protein